MISGARHMSGRLLAGTTEARVFHTAVLLPDGGVVVAGGFSDPQCPAGCWLASAELCDPGSAVR